MNEKRKRLLGEIVRYFISGGAFFWSGYAIFALVYSGLGAGVEVAKIISYLFGLTINFLLQRWWVFHTNQSHKNLPKVTGKYLLLSGINLLIDYGIVVSLARFGLTPYLGQFVSAGFFTVWNYLLYKLWVFSPTHPAHHVHHRQRK